MFSFSKKSLQKLNGVHPSLVKVANLAISRSPVDFCITHGVRTKEQQEALYAQGRTKPGEIVTWTLDSKHLIQSDGWGHAFDVAAYDNGKISWDYKLYDTIGSIVKITAIDLNIKIKWGGDFKRKDRPHFELA